MRKLIQELKVGGFSGTQGPLPGYLAEVWIPTKQKGKLERTIKSENWWMYGARKHTIPADMVPEASRPRSKFDRTGGGGGLKYYVRIEGPRNEREIKAGIARLGGVWLGRLDRSDTKAAAKWSKRAA
jgi:hypothetical protein